MEWLELKREVEVEDLQLMDGDGTWRERAVWEDVGWR